MIATAAPVDVPASNAIQLVKTVTMVIALMLEPLCRVTRTPNNMQYRELSSEFFNKHFFKILSIYLGIFAGWAALMTSLNRHTRMRIS